MTLPIYIKLTVNLLTVAGGPKSGVEGKERMKYGSGIKDRDDRSSGIEIRMADALPKINPTDPLILTKQAARRNLN